jgi:hypothetical protein
MPLLGLSTTTYSVGGGSALTKSIILANCVNDTQFHDRICVVHVNAPAPLSELHTLLVYI